MNGLQKEFLGLVTLFGVLMSIPFIMWSSHKAQEMIKNPENATDVMSEVIKEGVDQIAGKAAIRDEIIIGFTLVILGIIGNAFRK